MTTGTRGFGQRRRGHRGLRILMRLDGVNTVAVGAYGRLPVAAGDRLAVDALRVFRCKRAVAPRAGGVHVELEDGRLRIADGQNVMRVVAVRADGGSLRTRRHRAAVHTFLIRDVRL